MSYPPPPPPSGMSAAGQGPIDPQDRTLSIVAHVGTLANFIVGMGWLVPLIILLVKPDRPIVRNAAAESLNFQISYFAYAIGFGILSFALIGVPFLIAVGAMMIVLPIIAAVKTSEGANYRYPLTFRLVK